MSAADAASWWCVVALGVLVLLGAQRVEREWPDTTSDRWRRGMRSCVRGGVRRARVTAAATTWIIGSGARGWTAVKKDVVVGVGPIKFNDI